MTGNSFENWSISRDRSESIVPSESMPCRSARDCRGAQQRTPAWFELIVTAVSITMFLAMCT
jgi:hypothetical protein